MLSISRNFKNLINRNSKSVTLIAEDGEGSFVDGIYEPAEIIEKTIKMALFPLNMKMIKDLEEGQREDQAFTFYTSYRVRNKDEVRIGEEIFTINGIRDREAFIKGILTKSGIGEGGDDY